MHVASVHLGDPDRAGVAEKARNPLRIVIARQVIATLRQRIRESTSEVQL